LFYKPKTFIAFLFLAFPIASFSQFEFVDIGAKPVSLGGAFTSLANNSDAIFYNPAGISQLMFRELSVFYSPAPFGLKDLAYGTASYVEPTKFGSIGVAGKTYGFELYREVTATLNYANNYKGRIRYGANFNYYHLSIKNYGSASTLGIDVGMLAHLTDYLKWGFAAFNLSRAKIGQSKEKLPQVYRAGFTFQMRKDLLLTAEIEKDTRYTTSFKSGVEYSLLDMIDLRAGVSSEPTRFSAGVSFKYSLFEIEYAFYNHQDLGLTHQGSVGINFGGSEGRRKIKEQTYGLFDKPLDSATTKNKKVTEKIVKLKEGETINLNTATLQEILKLPSIGSKTAGAILEYRAEKKEFTSIDELLEIKGISKKKLEKIKKYIRLKD